MTTRLAFFGATGGTAGSCLAAALKTGGYICTALARTPSKLENALTDRGVSNAVMESDLKIVEGDVRDVEAVKRVIAGADIIVSGIGTYPHFQLSIRKPLAVTDKTICTDASKIILEACKSNYSTGNGKRPILIVISTAGVQEYGKPRALPLAYLPWYNWLLADPLADKVSMEEEILAHMRLPESARGISGYVIVKPSILTDGKDKSMDIVRAGTADNPPVGYSIDREILGLWMFHRLIDEHGAEGTWKDTRVTITY